MDQSCNLLRQNDPSIKSVHVTQDECAQKICSALQSNTVVEKITADFRRFGMPKSAFSDLNRFIVTSPSLKEFAFGTFCGSEALQDENKRLPFANLLLFTASAQKTIDTLTNVPLCQSTAMSFSNALTINGKLRNVSVDFCFEQDRKPLRKTIRLVRDHLAPDLARVISSSKLQSLSLNWMEYEDFEVGEAFFTALPGCLPPSLRQIELSNFPDSDALAAGISNLIGRSPHQLDSFMLSFCKFGDENFHRIFASMMSRRCTTIKTLHYGYLHEGTAGLVAENIHSFLFLQELGVGFDEYLEAFEAFCQKLSRSESLKTLDIQLEGLDDTARMHRFLRALAIALPKLPNLQSITAVHLHHKTPLVEATPNEFLAALQSHQNLVNFIPRRVPFSDTSVEYYLERNRYQDRLASTKPVLVEAIHEMNRCSAPVFCTLVKDALLSRDDWLNKGVDQGQPAPMEVEDVTTFHRFLPGLLF